MLDLGGPMPESKEAGSLWWAPLKRWQSIPLAIRQVSQASAQAAPTTVSGDLRVILDE